LVVSLQSIELLDVPRNLINKLFSNKQKVDETKINQETTRNNAFIYYSYVKNFESLIKEYGFNKQRFTFLLARENTLINFLAYLKIYTFKYLDFSSVLNNSRALKTLNYNYQWNNCGRDLAATIIGAYSENKGYHSFYGIHSFIMMPARLIWYII
jgi:hypothetical protein